MERVYAQQLASIGLQPSRAGLLVLLLGALASVAVALLSFLFGRIKLYRVPAGGVLASPAIRYPPVPRDRTHTSWLTIGAAIAAVGCITAIWLAPKNVQYAQEPVQPDLTPIALPASAAAGPGAGIYVEYTDGSGGMGCTAGFLVRTSEGKAAVLTAGHCNRSRQPSKVMMNLAGILPYAKLGTFVQTVNEGVHDEQHDIGLIVLDGDNVPQSPAIAAALPITGVSTDLTIGQQLCKYGMSSGEAECGAILDVTESKVSFAAGGQCGDSGGPVYLIRNDGTATAVGIDIRGSNPADPAAGCLAPAKFSVAELVQPWLDQWHLTAMTAPSSGPR
ncbi:MAG: S1 family peptidase [Actinomycetota bacterium]|uniref:S1 family peptidase n=1 Tax=Mycobacterium lentiflavum TaxID=141349 RepID=A0ABY3V4R3_MYCLN|nr:S1 family peptidase [Mycobacterium lentiflavum]MEE3063143.1 S1 family peptidase [Actinomycetota bacterium]ULP44487.1 S1 family peptidase [Mycobacterium lentiflavum]